MEAIFFKKRRILVTAALPYANSELHIGHARSTYIPADIYVRYHRLKNNEIYYVCGTDEHGTPISVLAEKENIEPIKITDKIYKQDLDDFKRLNISFDNFSRTTRPIHYDTTTWFFEELYKKKLIYSNTIKLPFCPKCDRYLPDRYVTGVCSFCGFENARGDECDNCNRALDLDELENPKCSICGSSAESRESKHWFLKLSKFQKWLSKWVNENEKLLPIIGKSYLNAQYLDPGLKDVCISRDLNWGVPIPLAEAKGKVCYVWFDAPIGYIDSTKELFIKKNNPNGWKDFWLSDDTELVHFIGKGILYHHTLFWPSMLKGTDYRLPTTIAAFSYGNLEGRKMSKGRCWYLSLSDFLDVFEADSLRYYWLVTSPLSEDADFVLDDFSSRYNNELADTLGNFVHRALVFCKNYFGSQVPEIVDKREEEKVRDFIKKTINDVENSIDKFDFREGLLSIIALARFGNKYFNDGKPWKTIKTDIDKARTTIGLCLNLVKSMAILILPYLPETGEKILNMLSVDNKKIEWIQASEFLKINHKIDLPEVLFNKIDEEKINILRKRIEDICRLGNLPSEISLDDFKEFDLSVGEIIEIKRLSEKKLLYRLKIKLSDKIIFEKDIKLSKKFPESSLKGLKIVLANHQKNKIKDLSVEKILLLKVKDDDNSYIPLILDKNIKLGSKIS